MRKVTLPFQKGGQLVNLFERGHYDGTTCPVMIPLACSLVGPSSQLSSHSKPRPLRLETQTPYYSRPRSPTTLDLDPLPL